MLSPHKRIARLGIIFLFAVTVIFSRGTAMDTHRNSVRKHTPPRIEAGALYPVIRVVDGDTADISINGQDERIRLVGLNTPETVDPRRPVECFGLEASNKARDILTGQKVRIETDPTQGMRDKYQRLLAYAFLPDGTLFNKTMIEEGYGHEYTHRLPYIYQAEFKSAEIKARKLKKGLWADGVCEK